MDGGECTLLALAIAFLVFVSLQRPLTRYDQSTPPCTSETCGDVNGVSARAAATGSALEPPSVGGLATESPNPSEMDVPFKSSVKTADENAARNPPTRESVKMRMRKMYRTHVEMGIDNHGLPPPRRRGAS